MRAVVMLFASGVQTEANGLLTIRGVVDAVTTRQFPVDAVVWVYLNLLVEPDEGGVAVNVRVELIAPDEGVTPLLSGDFFPPMQKHPEVETVWAPQFRVPLSFAAAGRYLVRVSVGDQTVTERPIRVAQA